VCGDHLLSISGCFATISLIDVILVGQAMLSLWVFLNHGVENLNPFLKANDMIFGDVSGFRARAIIEQDTGTLVERGKLRQAPCAFATAHASVMSGLGSTIPSGRPAALSPTRPRSRRWQ
jgi:hypothetical protein